MARGEEGWTLYTAGRPERLTIPGWERVEKRKRQEKVDGILFCLRSCVAESLSQTKQDGLYPVLVRTVAAWLVHWLQSVIRYRWRY